MGDRDVTIGGVTVAPGRREQIDLPAARLFTGNWLSLPVAVLNGRRPGPRLWLDAAIHGDELNGMEIIREVLGILDVRKLRGTVIAVPVVNVFGFIHQTRYLPDRRDLNRSFPGSERGSLTARLAHLFVSEIVEPCEVGIDLHTGARHRTNLPQIRARLDDPEVRRLAEAFGAPLLYQAPTIRGSLRETADKREKKLLVYEAGEPLRFNRRSIATGVKGVLRVLAALDMWPDPDDGDPPPHGFEGGTSRWLRASRSGVFHVKVRLGERVAEGQVIGTVSDPFSRRRRRIKTPFDGLVIGYTNNPLVHLGDALVHLIRPAEEDEPDPEKDRGKS